MTKQVTPRKLSWRKKILFSLVTTLGFLALCEAALTAAGVHPVTVTRDPFVGFSQHIPLMEVSHNEGGEEIVHTAANKLVWFNAQQFPKRKPAGTKRVFCLGGSTTYGHPYDDNTSFCGWLREVLPIADDSTQWELINCGGISYASYRVASVMEELTQYEPDLFIVYSVHNEFLERRTYASMFDRSSGLLQLHAVLAQTRTFAAMDRLLQGLRSQIEKGQANTPANEADTARSTTGQPDVISPNKPINILPGEVDEILNHTVGPRDYHRDPEWRRGVVAHYEVNLIRMVEIARRAGAQIVFVTPASNERDCAPFKSEFDAKMPAQDQERFWTLMHRAEDEANAGDFSRSLATLKELETLAPEFAHVHFRIGKLLMELGQHNEAAKAFTRALNEDICPLRAVDEISQAIHRVTSENDVPVVDFEQLLHEKSEQELGHRCLGEEYFADHVHPTIEVNQQLAMWIVDELDRAELISSCDLSSPDAQLELQAASKRVHDRIDLEGHAVALRNLAKVLHWAGKFDESAPRARDTLELLPGDPESRFVLADSLTHMGDIDGAIAEYELLFNGEREWGRAYYPYAELLYHRGDLERAKSYLLLGILRNPSNAYARYLLGKIHLELGEIKFAIESLEEANRLEPGDSATLEMLKNAKLELSKVKQ